MVVPQSPAVGIETLLQSPGKGGLRGQRVVHWQDGDPKVLGPTLQIGLHKTRRREEDMEGREFMNGETISFTVNISYIVKFMRNKSDHNKTQRRRDGERQKCGERDAWGWTLRSKDKKLWKLCVSLMSSVYFLTCCLDKRRMSGALTVTSIFFLLIR